MDVYGFLAMLKRSTRSRVSFILKIRLESTHAPTCSHTFSRGALCISCIFVRKNACNLYVYIYICKSLISITRYQDSSCLSHRSDNALQIRVTLSYPEAYSVSRIYRARLDSLLEQIAGYPRPCWVAARHLSSLAGCVSLSKRSAASSFAISWRVRQLESAELKLSGG